MKSVSQGQRSSNNRQNTKPNRSDSQTQQQHQQVSAYEAIPVLATCRKSKKIGPNKTIQQRGIGKSSKPAGSSRQSSINSREETKEKGRSKTVLPNNASSQASAAAVHSSSTASPLGPIRNDSQTNNNSDNNNISNNNNNTCDNNNNNNKNNNNNNSEDNSQSSKEIPTIRAAEPKTVSKPIIKDKRKGTIRKLVRKRTSVKSAIAPTNEVIQEQPQLPQTEIVNETNSVSHQSSRGQQHNPNRSAAHTESTTKASHRRNVPALAMAALSAAQDACGLNSPEGSMSDSEMDVSNANNTSKQSQGIKTHSSSKSLNSKQTSHIKNKTTHLSRETGIPETHEQGSRGRTKRNNLNEIDVDATEAVKALREAMDTMRTQESFQHDLLASLDRYKKHFEEETKKSVNISKDNCDKSSNRNSISVADRMSQVYNIVEILQSRLQHQKSRNNRLAEENRFLELTLERHTHEKDEKDAESDGAQSHINALQGLVDLAQGESSALKEHMQLLEERIIEKDKMINELREDVSRSEEEVRLFASESEAVKKARLVEGEELKAQIASQTEELCRLREYREYSRRQLEQTETELADNTTELHRARVEGCAAERVISEMRAEMEKQTKLFDQSEAENEQLRSQVKNTSVVDTQDSDALSQQLEELKLRYAETVRQFSQDVTARNLETEAAAVRIANSDNAQIKLKQQVKQLSEALQHANTERARVEREASEQSHVVARLLEAKAAASSSSSD